MSDEKQEGQKTIVSFIVGLLIGGLLVWAFSGGDAKAPTKSVEEKTTEESSTKTDETKSTATEEITTAPTPTLSVGEGKINIGSQAAGTSISLSDVTYPVSEGWIGVREYQNGQLGGLLGVSRFSATQGLVPNGIALQRATTAGKEYAVVIYTESGDRKFSLADDKQIDTIFATFTAQ